MHVQQTLQKSVQRYNLFFNKASRLIFLQNLLNNSNKLYYINPLITVDINRVIPQSPSFKKTIKLVRIRIKFNMAF
jgi:hypothetical protein